MALKTRHNGVHEYFEDKDILVFKNDGETFWWGLMKWEGKIGIGYQILTTGKTLAATEKETRRLACKARK